MLDAFSQHCQHSVLSPFCQELLTLSKESLSVNNGNIPKWQAALDEIKLQPNGEATYQAPYLKINTTDVDNSALQLALKQLTPWRKGPYQIGSLKLDSEWRGDMKWSRIAPHIKPLAGKTVLDVGAGNGYFGYLMAMAGASTVLGVEPFLLFNYQFQAIHSLINNPPNAFILPLRLEQMPDASVFDTVFSMGVLYHQKDHMAHLRKLKSMMTDDGELVLETLVIDAKHAAQIIPQDRYAKMRNVHCLPSTDTLRTWLLEAGFNNVKLVDVNQTTVDEQRATHWIGDNTQSLKDFLDPNNSDLTIEGLPAPRRAIFICSKN